MRKDPDKSLEDETSDMNHEAYGRGANPGEPKIRNWMGQIKKAGAGERRPGMRIRFFRYTTGTPPSFPYSRHPDLTY